MVHKTIKLTLTGWGPVILAGEWVVTGRLCKLGDPILCPPILCCTVRTTCDDAVIWKYTC